MAQYAVLGIALFSYNGTISWGFNCDYERMPDLADFVAAIDASFKELQRAARLKPKKTARKKSPRRQKAS